MSASDVVALVISTALLVYLVVALVFPERLG
ncbi:MAG: K(+)-transporting ATPase subunit F [Acidimicrobiales bacterium]|nr:K(+)-transporting ATPase subunit F [Acidimicrobiales bacterium]